MTEPVSCPACGTPQTQTGWGEDLCPICLLRLALQPLSDLPEAAEEAETDYYSRQHEGPLAPGKVLGNRYSVRKLLGRGGMGEVWRAFDLKLRVDVALKAMRQDLFRDQRRLELLRQEVRTAREVMSPNVCRIFDLVEAEGHELVSMEYVDGDTLLEVLQHRGPLELEEAQDIASQFLAGLEAIHAVGLVHRDVKPENIMITRAGRVVVMDFGLAREPDSGAGTVAGTPAYMAPEQAAGLPVDARADVYAAGVVLAEMVSREGIKNIESRQSVWEGVRAEPATLPDTPWAPVIAKAVAKEREQRYNSAHTLIRALEDVTLRVEGAEDLHPYPGLASFTEEDAEYFFGREAEVEQMWRKLEGTPRMLAVAGPSGAGKTSFLRAGLTPHARAGWAILRCTPGDAPFNALAGALAAETAGDPESVKLLLRFNEPDVAVDLLARWRRRHDHGLLVVDQFEELFTLNPTEVQHRFAELLGKLVLESDVVVLLSLRDDYLFHCHEHEPLRPMLTDLTMLGPPVGQALRRALVQPATKCGYRFEDDGLVDEMLSEVESERGALPLLAFAMARLWEKRDRENGLLTRQAYHDIGGVGGALARHAEETIDRIGSARVPIVRELFRNLVTAEGTRAVREWNDLLSVFDEAQRTAAEEVLRELIDARLLTSYEVREEDGDPTRRVEIIHESLLANWPRLVRWQTQDTDAAQLRDQLRQAARTWNDRDRPDDLLWAGSAFREFASWRERYPGGLSETEEAFAAAMTTLATRRQRRRRIAVASVLVIAAVVVGVTTLLWRRSVVQERRAEAQVLVTLGQLSLDDNPTATLAHAISSLEQADNEGARLLALTALWKGPTAFVVNEVPSWEIGFTPDGRHLVQTTEVLPSRIHVIDADGSDVELEEDLYDGRVDLRMDPSSGLFVTTPQGPTGSWALWSAPERRLVGQGHYEDLSARVVAHDLGQRRMLVLRDDRVSIDEVRFDRSPERLGTLPFKVRARCWDNQYDSWFAVSDGGSVYSIELGEHGLSEPRRLEGLDGPVTHLACDPLERFVAARYENGEIRLMDRDGTAPPTVMQGPASAREWFFGIFFASDGSFLYTGRLDESYVETWVWIWSLDGREATLVRRMDLGKWGGTGGWALDPIERQFVSIANPDTKIRLWPLGVPADAAPVILQRGDVGIQFHLAIDPTGRWLASSASGGLSLWLIARPYPTVLGQYEERVFSLVFDPDGRWLATSTEDSHGTVRLWRLEGDDLPPARVLHEVAGHAYGIAASPDGKQVLVATQSPEVLLLEVDGEAPRILTAAGTGEAVFAHTAISRDGRLGAAYGKINDSETRVIQVWDLCSLETVALLDLADLGFSTWPTFTHDGHLLSSGKSGVLRWDLETSESETVVHGATGEFAISADETRILVVRGSEIRGSGISGHVEVLDLESGTTTPLEAHGDSVVAVAMDAAGTIAVTGDEHGTIRVGPLTGEEPHLLPGRPEAIMDLAVDPKGRWIASSSGTEVRLWTIPDLSKPPLHSLPREELIAKLKTLTNVRVVRDEESATGWKLTHDPFPGWEEVPTW